MKLSKQQGRAAILCIRAISAAILISFGLGYPVSMQVLQAAELVTVLVNTIMLLLVLALIALLAGEAFMSTGLPPAPKPRAPLETAISGLIFATELAAFALIGWWFTLGLRVTAFVFIKLTPHEEPAA